MVMTIVTDATSALKNGTSTVLSTVRRRTKTTGGFIPTRSQKVVKQLTRRWHKAVPFKMAQTRPVPLAAIAIVVGGAAVAATAAILVRRYLAARGASEAEADAEELNGQAEASLDSKPDEELVTSL
jgi:hypothetical protein